MNPLEYVTPVVFIYSIFKWVAMIWKIRDNIRTIVLAMFAGQHHDSDVIMGAMASQVTALSLFTQPFIQAQIKENIKAPRHWPSYGNSPVTRTNGQYRGKCVQWWFVHAVDGGAQCLIIRAVWISVLFSLMLPNIRTAVPLRPENQVQADLIYEHVTLQLIVVTQKEWLSSSPPIHRPCHRALKFTLWIL